MTALPILTGDRAYLVPRTIGAPSAAWKQPACTVVRIANGLTTVRLDDGAEITTASANVSKTRRDAPALRAPRPAADPSAGLPDDCHQLLMFDGGMDPAPIEPAATNPPRLQILDYGSRLEAWYGDPTDPAARFLGEAVKGNPRDGYRGWGIRVGGPGDGVAATKVEAKQRLRAKVEPMAANIAAAANVKSSDDGEGS